MIGVHEATIFLPRKRASFWFASDVINLSNVKFCIQETNLIKIWKRKE